MLYTSVQQKLNCEVCDDANEQKINYLQTMCCYPSAGVDLKLLKYLSLFFEGPRSNLISEERHACGMFFSSPYPILKLV